MLPAAFLLLALCLHAPADSTVTGGRDTLAAARTVGRWEGRSLLDSGAPAWSVSAAEIERSGVRNLHEALRTLPGLQVQDYGGIGGLKTVSARGLGAAHTVLCLDGILLSDSQHGSIDLAGFDLDQTEGILMEIGSSDEIFRPASTFTSGSILSLESKMPDFSKAPLRMEASLMGGSFRTFKPSLRLDGQLAPGWGISFSGSYLTSRGDYPFRTRSLETGQEEIQRREGGDVSTVKPSLQLTGNTRRGGKILVAAEGILSGRGLPGPVIYYTRGATERLQDRNASLRGSYTRESGRWKLRLAGRYQYAWTRFTDTDPAYPETVDDRYEQQSLTLGGILQYSLPLGAGVFRIAGAEDLSLSHLWATLPSCPFPSRFGSVGALSAQWETERFKATVSLAGTLMHEWVEIGEAAPEREHLSPAFSLSWMPVKGLRLRAFVKEGFRVPTFNDLYYDRIGTVSLAPERAFQSGGGLTWQQVFGPLEIHLTADGYYNRVKDKILAVPTLFVWRMRNLGKARMTGVDLSAGVNMALIGPWRMRGEASWSWMKAVDLSDPTAKNYGHQIPYSPLHSGSASLSVFSRRLSLQYTLIAVGKRYFQPQNIEENLLPAYLDQNLSLRWEIPLRGMNLSLGAEVLNLGGVQYEIVRSYPMPSRQLRLSMKIQY